MDWRGCRVLVVGLGKSGVAAAKVLAAKGAEVTVTDIKPAEALGGPLGELAGLPVRVVAGHYPEVGGDRFDLVIQSPGVPLHIPPLAQAREAEIPIWSEIELAFAWVQGPVVAITGTNGKTTTTALTGQIFQDAGRRTVVAGNIGVPLVQETVQAVPGTVFVVEVSSFQLECTRQFRPQVAVILNITPDHLDRHGTMEAYIQAKARIFALQQSSDWAVLNYDDPVVRSLANQVPGRVLFFSRENQLPEGVFVRDGEITVRLGDRDTVICRSADVRLRGAHNLENALAAVAASWVMGIAPDNIAHTLATFPGVPHRLEQVGELNGVKFINDSKATNPDAAIKALDAFTLPLVLIAGGRNKGSDFSPFAAKIKEKVKAVVLVGEAREAIGQALADIGFEAVYPCDTFAGAVHTAARLAEPGDVVLLSPACASWDMFNNFEERGDLFRHLVGELVGNHTHQ